MKREIIFRNLLYYSICLFVAMIIDLILFILFNTIIQLDLGIYTLNIITLVMTSGFISIHVILYWLLLLIAICGILAFSVVLFIISLKKNIDDNYLPKYILLFGLFFLLSGFIEMTSIFLLANSVIHYNSITIVFQNALYTDTIAPFIGGVVWIYFTAITCAILLSGVIFSGIGLKSFINMERKS